MEDRYEYEYNIEIEMDSNSLSQEGVMVEESDNKGGVVSIGDMTFDFIYVQDNMVRLFVVESNSTDCKAILSMLENNGIQGIKSISVEETMTSID